MQFQDHLETNKIFYHFHSGFRPHIGREFALSEVQNYLLEFLVKSEFASLILLDISTTFDTLICRAFLEKLEGIGA